MCRLAVLFGRPLHEVACWPAEDVRTLDHYLAKQPAPIERVELAVARFTAIYVNAHLAKGATEKETRDFLPYLDPWPTLTSVDQGRYSPLDLEILKTL